MSEGGYMTFSYNQHFIKAVQCVDLQNYHDMNLRKTDAFTAF